jgi:SAM-dependent methyltransferase
VDSHEVRRQWAERAGEYSPEYYAYYGPDEASEAVRESLAGTVDRDAPVLEVGCSSGRHLAHLHDHGFESLAGVELNGDAFEVMAETYPGLAAAATLHHAAIEDVVGTFEDGAFGAVFSVETLQHVHPESAWVFAELARVTDDLLVTVENERRHEDGETTGDRVDYVREGVPLYYRDWNEVFTDLGLVETASRRVGSDTLRVFRTPRN